MAISIVQVRDTGSACARFLGGTSQGSPQIDRAPVWLLPDYERALDCRKGLASCDSEFRCGCEVSAFVVWVNDMWALYGDGRIVVSTVQRKLLMARALEAAATTISRTAGTVDLLCRMVRDGAGIDAFADALESEPECLTQTQSAMLSVARAYLRELSERNLCERAEAMRLLAADESIVWPRIACEGFASLAIAEAAFFSKVSARAEILFAIGEAPGSDFDVAAGLKAGLNVFGAHVVESADAHAFARGSAGEEGGSPLPQDGAIAAVDGVSGSAACDRGFNATGSARDGFFAGLTQEQVELAELTSALYGADASGGRRIASCGAVRVLAPAGRYAQPALLAKSILHECGSVLVACNKPERMFADLAPRLKAAGVAAEASYFLSFPDTDFGAALLSAYGVFVEGFEDVFEATDFMLSDLAGRGLRTVQDLDARWRGRRILSEDDVLDDLDNGRSSAAASFARFVRAGEFTEAFEFAEQRYLSSRWRDDAFVAEQIAAIKCARRVVEQAEMLGIGFAGVLVLLESMRVEVRVASVVSPDGRPKQDARVRFASYFEAATLPAASYDVVYACDLNAEDQPLRVRRTSADGLFEALGCEYARDALFEARLRMLRVVQIAKHRLRLVRIMHDVDAAPLYPAVAFEEIASCYAETLPTEGAGEESLVRNLAVGESPRYADIGIGPADAIADDAQAMLLEPMSALSPSAIECYLDCPHKWFARRRLGLSGVDAAFSEKERGSFVHEVLQSFYESHRAAFGKAKPLPTPEGLAQAKALLGDVFTQVYRGQVEKSFFDNPYIAITPIEQRQVEELRRHLVSFIERDAAMLPDFEPCFLERPFGFDEPFSYAGFNLRGSIDRVDVDSSGRAVVIDYKSSLGDSYHVLPAGCEEGLVALPAKVQTLIYAQVVRKVLNLKPVGALYVHTLRPGSQNRVCGAYDDRVFSSNDIPGINVERNALSCTQCVSFEDLLDRVEEMVSQRLGRLWVGDVSAAPSSEKACSFCPVLSCEGRM